MVYDGGVRTPIGEVEVNGIPRPFIRDEDAHRFELMFDDGPAFIDFRQRDRSLSLLHTEVPAALRGKGVGDVIAVAVLDYARTQDLLVKPFCAFVAKYIARHPQYDDLVDPSFNLPPDAG